MYVFMPPSTASTVPNASRSEPTLKCLSLNCPATSSLRVDASSSILPCVSFCAGVSATASVSPEAVTISFTGTVALSSAISSWIVRTRRHCRPVYPAYTVANHSTARPAGCTSAAVRPSSRPYSPPLANASCAPNRMGFEATVANSARRPASRVFSSERGSEEARAATARPRDRDILFPGARSAAVPRTARVLRAPTGATRSDMVVVMAFMTECDVRGLGVAGRSGGAPKAFRVYPKLSEKGGKHDVAHFRR